MRANRNDVYERDFCLFLCKCMSMCLYVFVWFFSMCNFSICRPTNKKKEKKNENKTKKKKINKLNLKGTPDPTHRQTQSDDRVKWCPCTLPLVLIHHRLYSFWHPMAILCEYYPCSIAAETQSTQTVHLSWKIQTPTNYVTPSIEPLSLPEFHGTIFWGEWN